MPTLQWLGRDEAVLAADRAPFRLLERAADLSAGDADTGNLLIQGDNLDALKALLPVYAGRVKCIAIDPPYNTGSAFQQYDDNLEHSTWLSLIFPRMLLMRDLLSSDGTLWITIDDDEGHYLKVICDEVFGRNNFVANVVWQKKYTVANDASGFSDNHDHVLVYTRERECFSLRRLERPAFMDKAYKNPDNHPKGPWKATPLHAKSGTSIDAYTFSNGVTWKPPEGTYRRYNDASMARLDAGDEVWFGVNGRSTPSRKTFLSELKNEGITPRTIWLYDEVGHNHEAREEVKVLIPNDVFATPKPERLLQRILSLSTNPGDLVLDSFLGSGTTAAVAHKMGRRYIGIEMGDHAVTHCVPRLRKVIEGEQGGISKDVGWKGGGGFRFMRLGPPVFDETGVLNADIRFPSLAAHIWFSETHTPWVRESGTGVSPVEVGATGDHGQDGHATGDHGQDGRATSALLGVHKGTAYYLLFNGVLGDRRPDGGNVLNTTTYKLLPPHDGPKVVYGEWSQWRPDRLRREDITFKMIPYDIKVR